MKYKIFLLFSVLLILSSCGLQQPKMPSLPQTTVTSENNPYESIIKSKIAEFSKDTDSEQLLNNNYYAYCDIDSDGTEELLLGSNATLWGYENEFLNQSCEEKTVLNQIYTAIDRKAQEITCQPVWRWKSYFAECLGGRDILSNGIIRYYGGTPDYISYAYFRYSDGKLEFIKALMSYEIAGTWVVVDNQGEDLKEKISEDEFERIKSEIEDGADVVDINWQPLENRGK